MTLPAHLFVGCDGDLYDTRTPCWSAGPPLRRGFAKPRGIIGTIAHLKAQLRAGEYAWPGGYQRYFICNNGDALSFDGVRKDFRKIVQDMREGWAIDEWPNAVEVNWEDGDLWCAITNDRIPASYGED